MDGGNLLVVFWLMTGGLAFDHASPGDCDALMEMQRAGSAMTIDLGSQTMAIDRVACYGPDHPPTEDELLTFKPRGLVGSVTPEGLPMTGDLYGSLAAPEELPPQRK